MKGFRKAGLICGLTVAILATALLSGCNAGQPQKPAEDVIKDGIAKLATLKSAKFDVSLKGDTKDPTKGANKVDLKAAGLLDLQDMKAPKVVLNLTGSVANDQIPGADLSAEARIDKDMAYLNVMKLSIKEAPGKEMALPTELTSLFNTWWFAKIPQEALEEISASSSATAGGTQATPEAQQKLAKQLSEANVLTKPTLVATEDVMGEQSWHFKSIVDNKNAIAFAKKMAEEEGQTISDSELKTMEEELAKMTMNIDVWVGTVSGMANKFKLEATMKGGETEQSGTISLEVALGDMNKTLTVERPQAEELTEEKMLPLLMMMRGGAAMPTTDLSGVSTDTSLGGELTTDGSEVSVGQ